MDFLVTLLNGVSLGGVYAMIALGYTMVYGIAKLLNFAHGDIIMVGGYTIYLFVFASIPEFLSASTWAILMPILAIICAVIVCVILGVTVERVAYRPLRGASPLAVLITAIGVSYLLQSLALVLFGADSKMVVVFDLGAWTVGDIRIKVSTVVTLVASVLVMLALTLFVKYSKTGRAMVAVSEDRDAARLMGININGIITVTFAIGSALAALAGLFSLLDVPSISPSFGAMPGIKAFTAAVIGGIGSIPGAMLGGILIGIVECVCNSVPELAPYTIAIEFAILIVILLVKPTGILGKKRREKV
jgi:branched-chain amino acid transport system permease protein